ncbi:MAG: hypothetical protein Q8868_03435, partial [Bacteroidota bacterium]|nr:hypothetical protein [Bacteroidota bacterium]
LVFLGIDDGTDSGLRRLNKNMTVEESLKGINILKKLDIGFDYGFMLFQPSSTISSVNDNLEFLSKICGDGYTPVSFLKLRPYFDTQVEKELRKAGRLKGKPGYLDYDFFDNRLNYYYQFVTSCSMKWLRDAEGLVNISRWARNYVSVFSKYFNPNSETRIIFGNIRGIIENSNNFLLNTMKDLLILFESEQKNDINFSAELIERKKQLKIKHFYFKEYINSCIDELVYASKPNLSPLPFDENLSLLFRSKINPKQK